MTACRSRTPTTVTVTVTATATRRPAEEMPARRIHNPPPTPAPTMIPAGPTTPATTIPAGPTTGPATATRRTVTTRVPTMGPTPRRAATPAGTGEVMDAPAGGGESGAAPSPAEIAEEEQAWDEAMHQAASLAKAQGKLPGAVEETVNLTRQIVALRVWSLRLVTSGTGNSDSLYRSGHRMGLRQDANPRVSLAAADLSMRNSRHRSWDHSDDKRTLVITFA